jgi:hypothetical protein
MRIAVLFSPDAGKKKIFNDIGSVLARKLKNHKVFTGQGGFGKLYIPEATEIAECAGDYRTKIAFMTLSLSAQKPDLFICVGGDGLGAYVADTLITNGLSVPVMGIAGGTANVGPIIATRLYDLDSFDPENLIFSSRGAIHVRNGGRHTGYAFNDVVIGNTFLGTIDGETKNISVEELLVNNKKVPVTPSCNITADEFRIAKNGKDICFSIKKPAQIVVSPLEVDKFYGRAVTGVLCHSAYSPLKAAMGLFDNIIVGINANIAEQLTKSEHILFGPGDLITVTGLSDEGHIIIDGNPYLRKDEVLTFEYKPGLIEVAEPFYA